MAEGYTEPFSVHYVHLEPNRQIGQHNQPTWELAYVVVGSGKRIVGGDESEFRSGEVLLIPPGIEHCWQFNDKNLDKHGRISNVAVMWTHDYMMTIAESLPQIDLDIEALSGITNAIKFTGEAVRTIRQLMMQMLKEPDYLRAASFIRLLLIVSHTQNAIPVGKAEGARKRMQDKRKSIETFVSCNLSRTLTLDVAAGHLGMNRSSFCVFFKREFGQNFFAYLNARRISMACYLLKSDAQKSVSQVCFACGFTSLSYFDRLFKKTMGQTPKAYRALL